MPGERLPAVRQLARDLTLAPGTIAKAYKQLEVEGLVISRSGAGTRVNSVVTSFPVEILYAARGLFKASTAAGLSLDETISALRAIWLSEADSD